MKIKLAILAALAVLCGSAAAPEPLSSKLAGTPDNAATLSYYLATNILSYTNGHTSSYNDTRLWDHWQYQHYTATNIAPLTNAIWSRSFWLHDVAGLSATSLGFSNGMGGQGLITMVSPRHYLFATHTHPEGNLTFFLDTNNVLYLRTTLQRADVTNDTSVGILNADLPASVGFLPVLPANFSKYLPTNSTSVIQGLGMNQDPRIFSQPMSFAFPPFLIWNSVKTVPFGLGTNWNVWIRGGDSSDPEMLLISNQLVLVSHNYSSGGGPNYAFQINAINQAMHYLSTNNAVRTDYQLKQYPLTNWPALH